MPDRHLTYPINKRLRLGVILALTLLSNTFSFGQNSGFIGMLEYKATMRDTAMQAFIPESRMVVYTNDTVTRTENMTSQLGQQAVIRHMDLNKSYLLLDTPLGKFAIQTDLNKPDTVIAVSNYSFEKKCMKRKLLGHKVKRLMVSHPEFEEPIEFWYLPNISSKYNNAFTDLPGLPVKYSIASRDGIIDYELVKISEYAPDRDLFGVPSDHERISFDDFLEKMISSKQTELEIPE
ncbi:MAG: hypothetical protein QNK23_18215 [Crocinitomicaceae bacterium]|nr:hypothetical protein [Crocinitomicaceae bacterium]